MKRTAYILVIALLCAVACQKEINVDTMTGVSTTSVAPPPGTMVKVDFTVSFPDLPATTRSTEMADEPNIETMYLAVLGDGLFIQNWIPATLVETVTLDGSANKKKYSAYLPVVDEERTIHFIVNPPTDNDGKVITPQFDYEWNVFPSMVTTGNHGAYWQRIFLEDGILAKKNASGDYELDSDGNYIVDEDSVKDLQLVYLVRNFAKIVVKSGSKMFDVGDWTLINYPDRGSIAPYDQSLGQHVFSQAYMNIKNYDSSNPDTPEENLAPGAFYDALTATYIGYSPEGTEINHTWPSSPTFVGSGEAMYMYERPVPEEYQTSVVVEINWKTQAEYVAAVGETEAAANPIPAGLAGKTYWYKIEILNKDGEYMPLLRNIQYTMSIDGLNEAGYETAQAAFNGNYFGNISSSLETASLNEVSNGLSRIYVDYMDQTFVQPASANNLYTLNYWFDPNDADNTAQHLTKSGTYNGTTVTIGVTTKNVSGYVNPIKDLDVDYDTGVISFNVKERTTTLQKGIIRVQGQAGTNRALFREVTINVIGDLVFTSETKITTTPTTDATDQEVEIQIGLGDDIPASIFPIQVRIEAEQNSLSSTSPTLPVANGPSQFSSKAGQNSFYYIYTINFTDYQKVNQTTHEISYVKEFKVKLYTTKSSGNSTSILISDMNDYFTPKPLTLTIPSGS